MGNYYMSYLLRNKYIPAHKTFFASYDVIAYYKTDSIRPLILL